jgi:UDPglucose 6-dehydrogenase
MFSNKIVQTLYNTVADKNSILGMGFQKTPTTPENRRQFMLRNDLINEQAQIAVYDPKVSAEKKYWLIDYLETRTTEKNSACVTSFADPYGACKNAHAIASADRMG